MTHQITLACLFVVLVMWLEHWFPWQYVLRRKLPRFAAYVIGMAGVILPLTYLFWLWIDVQPAGIYYLVGLWSLVISAGVAVGLAYVFDWIVARVVLSFELAELEKWHGRQIDSDPID